MASSRWVLIGGLTGFASGLVLIQNVVIYWTWPLVVVSLLAGFVIGGLERMQANRMGFAVGGGFVLAEMVRSVLDMAGIPLSALGGDIRLLLIVAMVAVPCCLIGAFWGKYCWVAYLER